MNKVRRVFAWAKTHRLATIIVLAAFAAVGVWGGRRLGGEPLAQRQTAKVTRGTLVAAVSASGQVAAANLMTVSTDASGLVKSVAVSEGDTVFPGQQIMEIELDSAGQRKKAQAWSSYLAAQSAYETAKQSKISTQASLESAKSKLITAQLTAAGTDNWDPTDKNKQKIDADRRNAELNVQLDQQKLVSTELAIQKTQSDLYAAGLSYQMAADKVTAPVGGIISDLVLAPGMTVGSSSSSNAAGTTAQKLATVRSEGAPVVSLNVTEADVAKIKPGQKTTVVFDSLTDRTFTGVVTGIDRTGVVSSGVTNYPLNVKLETSPENVFPNMAATADIIVETKDDVLLVPSAALQTRAGQSVVRVLRGGREETIVVETGLSSETQTEIVSGLNEGDEVITGTVSNASTPSRGGGPLFGGGGFGGGALRPGGFGGGSRGGGMQR